MAAQERSRKETNRRFHCRHRRRTTTCRRRARRRNCCLPLPCFLVTSVQPSCRRRLRPPPLPPPPVRSTAIPSDHPPPQTSSFHPFHHHLPSVNPCLQPLPVYGSPPPSTIARFPHFPFTSCLQLPLPRHLLTQFPPSSPTRRISNLLSFPLPC